MKASEIAPRLADLLRTIHPEVAEEVYRQAVPVALRDQLDAAGAQTSQGLDRLADMLGGRFSPTSLPDVPDAVLLPVVETLLAWAAGQAETCTHCPHPSRPEPVFAAAWKPGLLVCGKCGHLFALPRGGDKDRTCDLCGRVSDAVTPRALQYGALTYMFGTCADCGVSG